MTIFSIVQELHLSKLPTNIITINEREELKIHKEKISAHIYPRVTLTAYSFSFKVYFVKSLMNR